jgi:tRNA (cmo5U34)-methyltransferase
MCGIGFEKRRERGGQSLLSVAEHLGISLTEYDRQIRTFIPDYDEILEEAAAAIERNMRMIVELGIGTGELAARSLSRAPRAQIVGIDLDPEILDIAKKRLRGRAVTFIEGNLERIVLPRCDAVVASFALHHIRTEEVKRLLYERVFASLRQNGILVNADCCPATNRRLAVTQMRAWRSHLAEAYGAEQARAYLRMWAREDFYIPLNVEQRMMEAVGFEVDVAWRRGAFAVLVARKPRKKGSKSPFDR